MAPWTEQEIPALGGRLAVVTGANSGLGFETALALVRSGARVVLACRDQVKGAAARDRILEEVPGAGADLAPLDLSDLASVEVFADGFCSTHDRLDILVNNAGVMAIPRRETADGFEMQFGTNHLGHFALTGRLLGPLLATPGARVVTVTSLVARMGRIRFDDLQGTRHYGKWSAYAQSKLANQLFTRELDRRAGRDGSRPDGAGPDGAGPDVAGPDGAGPDGAGPDGGGLDDAGPDGAGLVSVASHPGYAATNLQLVAPRMSGSHLGERMNGWANTVFAQSAAAGALPSLFGATAPGVRGGQFFGPDRLFGARGHPHPVDFVKAARDPETAGRLWDVSVELTGVTYAELDRTR
jgi:NAD(P)-dependent dehydrogenase (short-subunit alcohol dehydrogenase family)